MPTVLSPYVVGEFITATKQNQMVTAITELQPPSGFSVGTIGSSPVANYAVRQHGWLVDARAVIVYSSAPSSLTLNVTAIPSGYRPQAPGGTYPQGAALVFCYGSVGLAGTRYFLPAFLNASGQVQIRGGATNPNSLDNFEVWGTYSIP